MLSATIKQMEFLFSDSIWTKRIFLEKLYSKGGGGWGGIV